MKRFLVVLLATMWLAVPLRAADLMQPQPLNLDVRGRDDSIDNAIGVFVSPRGQTYFRDHLQDVLYRNGISLGEAYFPAIEYKAAQPLDLSAIPALARIRDALTQWLSGFALNNPLFDVKIDGLHYRATLKVLGLRTGEDVQRELKLSSGVGMILDAEIPDFQIDLQTLRISDRANAYLGTFGGDQFSLATKKGTVPLTLELPMALEIDPVNGPKMNVLGFATNLSKVALQMGFKSPLLFPDVEIKINSKVMKLNHKTVETALLDNQASIIESLQGYLNDFSEQQLPALINDWVKSSLVKGLEDVNQMDPPGDPNPNPTPDEKFLWGIGAESAEVNHDGLLFFGLQGYVTDPKSTTAAPVPATPVGSLDAVDGYDSGQYDLALSLNQNFVDRILQLSFLRGYFSHIDIGQGQSIQLADAPALRVDGTDAKDKGKVHLVISQDVSGLAQLLVVSPIEVAFDLGVKIDLDSKGHIQVLTDQIDVNSASVDDRFIRFGFLKGLVMDNVRSQLDQVNQQLQGQPHALVSDLPAPPTVLGIPIALKEIQAEKSGHIVLYMAYGQ